MLQTLGYVKVILFNNKIILKLVILVIYSKLI